MNAAVKASVRKEKDIHQRRGKNLSTAEMRCSSAESVGKNHFNAADKVLQEQGVSNLHDNIGGRGEYGEEWILDDNSTSIPNVFADF